MKNKIIEVQNVQISISKQELDDYICITDIAKAKSGDSRCADIVNYNDSILHYIDVCMEVYITGTECSCCSRSNDLDFSNYQNYCLSFSTE